MQSPASRLKEDEEPYGSQSAKIIPFHDPEKERDYTLKIVQQSPVRKVLVGKRSKERHDPKLISDLYRRFVAPLYTSVIKATRLFFIKHTIPYLLNVMGAEAAVLLSLAFYNRHSSIFSDCSKEAHTKQTMVTVTRHTYPQLPVGAETSLARLKNNRQREAFRIMAHLSVHHPEFYMSTRDMQARLLLPSPMTAHRIFERLCKLGLIEKSSAGLNHRESKMAGKKPSAATFRLKAQA